MTRNGATIPLPKQWPKYVQSGVLHVISLARLVLLAARGPAARSRKARVRLRAELEAARGEIALLEWELEIYETPRSSAETTLSPQRTPGPP